MMSDKPPHIDPLRPIHRAIMNNDVTAFRAEVAAGVDINLPGLEGMTPLHVAADRGNVEIAKILLAAGANIDPINVWGNTPLWISIRKRRNRPDGSMIKLLLEHGSDPNISESESPPVRTVRLVAGFPEEWAQLVEVKAAELKGAR
jgi:ankyrin repeat protein